MFLSWFKNDNIAALSLFTQFCFESCIFCMYINSFQVSDFIISCLYQVTEGHNQKKEFSQVGPNSFILLLCHLKWETNIQQAEFSLNLKVVSYDLKENEYTWKIFCVFL